MYLYDEAGDRVFVPMSLTMWNELRYKWSEPVQARVENDELVFRTLTQVGRFFAAPEKGQELALEGEA